MVEIGAVLATIMGKKIKVRIEARACDGTLGERRLSYKTEKGGY